MPTPTQTPPAPTQPTNVLDPQVVNLAKAIRTSETGNRPDAATAQGKSGEIGAYQFTKQTWNNLAQKYGINADFGKATIEQQNEAAYKQIKEWKDAGHNVGQIAAMWNAGVGEPDAYQGTFTSNTATHKAGDPSVGINQHGVKYDVPAYAKAVAETYQALKAGSDQGVPGPSSPGNEQYGTPPTPPKDTTVAQDVGDVGKGVVKGIGSTILDTAKMIGNEGPKQALSMLPGAGLITPFLKSENFVPGLKQTNQAVDKFSTDHLTPANTAQKVGYYGEKVGELAVPGLIGEKAYKGATVARDALEIVAPKASKGVVTRALKTGNTAKSGLLGNVEQTVDSVWKRAANAIKPLVEDGRLKPSMDVSTKSNAILDEIGSTAENLDSSLANMEITPTVGPEDLTKLQQDAMTQIGENPTLTGDAEKQAQKIFDKFNSFLPKQTNEVDALGNVVNKGTREIDARDVLTARKKLDAWIKTIRAGNVFDPQTENAISIALRAIRQGANKLVAEKAPDVAVKQLLDHQSALYDALDNVVEKGWKEVGTNAPQRFSARHPLISSGVKFAGRVAADTVGLGSALHMFGQ